MSAYVIFTRTRTTNPEEFAKYGPMARQAAQGHDLTRLAFYGDFEVLEGDAVEGVVVLRFPDMAAARAWYNSPAYQAARDQRFKGAEYRVVLVEGMES